MNKVIYVDSNVVRFDDKSELSSDHNQDCWEHHYLDFSNLTLADFSGLEFDLSSDKFFEKVEDFGIRLVPVVGHPISVPGYGSNNGYYSANLSLVLERPSGTTTFNITECQEVSG